MTYRPFDIVVVPFPFTDRHASKRRPALVVSSDAFNLSHDQLILAMITTAARSTWPSDIPIADLEAAGLRALSIVRLKLFTLDKMLILRTIGQLTQKDREMVQATLNRFLSWHNE